MGLARKLNHKWNGAKMLITGIGGVIINEIAGTLHDEPITTYELAQLPKGYIIKGFGHLTGNNNLIEKGRNYINNYRLSTRIKQSIFKK